MAVRNESVRLSLQDDFTSGMARAAAAAALLNRELNSLSGQTVVTARVSQSIARDTDNIAKSANRADGSINQLTGRLRLMADAAAILGPALVPIGAVAIPAVMGLANQLGVAALAGGSAIIAFQGVGDALKAVNEAAIEPTAANLNKAREAMDNLSPAAQDMVNRLQELRPVMTGLRDTAAAGLFPGVLEAFDSLEQRVPEVTRILENVTETLGDVVASGAEGLASNRWDDFFAFLATEVPATLVDLGRTVGDLTHGMAELWMAFDPLNDDFNGWLRDVASGFDSWASGLAQTEGFREFIDYIQTTGPQVADTFGALANAVVQIVQAAAPLGGPVLAGIEAFANVISAIADSDLGTPILTAVAAMALLSRVTKTYAALAATSWGGTVLGSISAYASSLLHVTTAQERATASATKLDTANKTLGSSLAAIGGIAAGAAVIGTMVDAWDDAALSATQMELALRKLGDGQVDSVLQNLSLGADSFADSLKQAAFADNDWLTSTDEIEELDRALASLDDNEASRAFAEIAEQGRAAGLSMEDLTRIFPEYSSARSLQADADYRAALAGRDAAGAMRAQADAADGAADGYIDAAGAVETFSQAVATLNGMLDERSAFRNYQQAIDDFRTGIRETGRSFDVMTQKGRDNQARLDDIAKSAGVMAEQLRGVARTRFVDGAIAQLKTMAANMNIPRAQVRDLIRELRDLGKQKPKPKPELDDKEANSSINAMEERINDLDRMKPKVTVEAAVATALEGIRSVAGAINGLHDKNVNITTTHTTLFATGRGPAPYDPTGARGVATGGYISGPGGPRDDLIPARLSNGEYVIQAAAVARYGRAMFDRLNAMQFANGGYVGRQISQSSVSNSSSTSYSSSLTLSGPITHTDPNAIARAVTQRQRDLLNLSRSPV